MTVNPAGGSGTEDGRDSWCTPKWLADILGKFDLDPCSNERSHIQAARKLSLPHDDGLYGYPSMSGGWYARGRYVDCVKAECYTFINPPYARGEVIKWVKHWRHTRFCFLLRWDPSTDWFAELIPHCTHVWFPPRRINFEPPPGVKSSSNPFPHALYLRDPDQEMLERLSASGFLFPVDQDLLSLYLDADDRQSGRSDEPGDEGQTPASGSGASAGAVSESAPAVASIPEWIPASEPQPFPYPYGYLPDYAKTKPKKKPIDFSKLEKWKPKDDGCGSCVGCKYGFGCTFRNSSDTSPKVPSP